MSLLNELRDAVHATAVDRGWWGGEYGIEHEEARARYGAGASSNRSFGEMLMLVVTEVSEAMEDWRNGKPFGKIQWQYATGGNVPSAKFVMTPDGWFFEDDRYPGSGQADATRPVKHEDWLKAGYEAKPHGIPVELADIIIRVLDICGAWNVDIAEAVEAKMAYNKVRPQRHGGKRA